MARKSEIEARGAQLIAIGNGAAYWGQAFVADEKVDFPVFTDPGRGSYKAFGMKRGLTQLLRPKVLKHGKRAAKLGFKQTATRGDPLQNGGIIVVGADGGVLFTHIENETGDLADIDAVIASLPAS